MEIPTFNQDEVANHLTNGHRLIGNPTLAKFLLPVDLTDPESYLISKGISTWLSEYQIYHSRERHAGARDALSSPGMETLEIVHGYVYAAGDVSKIAEILNLPIEKITHGIERVVEF